MRRGSSNDGVPNCFGVSFIEFLDEFVSVYVDCWLPAIVSFQEPFPPDQILDLTLVPPDMEYLFDFPFGLTVDKFRGGFLIMTSIQGRLLVGCEKSGVEDVVDLPLGREF